MLHRSAAGPAALTVPPLVNSVLGSPGRSLDPVTRSSMESRFGHDLGGVRVHTDSRAAESARAVNAHAYTVGQDIVFDRGRYDPLTAGGRHLLAHEVAHTIQQGGLQRSPAVSLEMSPEYSALEHEADRAADAVAGGFAAPWLPRTNGPVLSRQVDTHTEPATGEVTAAPPPVTDDKPADSKPGVPRGATALASTPPNLNQSKLDEARVAQILDTDPPGGIYRVFVIDNFELPAEKGPLSKQIYDDMAAAGQLRATIDFGPNPGDKPSAGAKQARDVPATLRKSWLQRVDWRADRAAAYWKQVGGKEQAQFKPTLIDNTVCDMDHIVELQVGGTNVPDNIQVLNPTPNRASGAGIFIWLSEKAQLIRDAYPATNRPRQITMHFRSVTVNGTLAPFQTGSEPEAGKDWPAAPDCITIECRLRTPLTGARGQAAPAGRDLIRLFSGAQGASLYALATGQTDLNEPLPQNRGVRQLVPGFILDRYTRGAAGTLDGVAARIDNDRLSGRSGRTSLPMNITKHPNPRFKAEDADSEGGAPRKKLSFDGMDDPVMQFNYPYLSPGDLRLAYNAETGITGKGTMRSDKPLLRNLALNLALGEGRLDATLAADVTKWRPLGSARVTRAQLAATLLPDISALGDFDIAFGPTEKPYATANLNVTANAQGIEASGTIRAHIPRVDDAKGQVLYRNGQWTGQIRIESTQIQIPNVTRCTVVVDVNADGVHPSGEIVLDVQGNPITLGAHLEKNVWVFTGQGRFSVSPLDPTTLAFRYADGHLTATGSTGFTYRKLPGTVKLRYDDGIVSGEGTLNMTRGRMSGTIKAHLLPSGVITADGTITYQVTPSLTGTVGIAINERQEVRLTGALTFASVEIFRRFAGQRELFKRSLDIPIVGISVGPASIGLVFRITGALGVDYGIGPGEIRDLSLKGGFNPFDPNPNVELEGDGRLVIPASAGFTTSVRGALAVSAGIASVSGGVTASARVGLAATASNALHVAYRQGVYVIDNVASVVAQPVLTFGLAANVEAEALAGAYTYHRGYQLASYRLGSNMQFGIKAPFHFASNEPFRAPALDDIQFIRPELDVSSIMRGMLEKVGVA
jgi:hypothetical protein